jgi:predicted transcriptional regulator
MNDVKITIGGAMEDKRRGGSLTRLASRSAHLAFESWDALARVLTGKRTELLRYVRRHDVTSVRGLATALGRDYGKVHADVQALTAAGLLDAADGGIHTDYDAIETRIAI